LRTSSIFVKYYICGLLVVLILQLLIAMTVTNPVVKHAVFLFVHLGSFTVLCSSHMSSSAPSH